MKLNTRGGYLGHSHLVSVLLMDVAHVARMLYYAGHGSPPKPAKVLVSYDGAAHTENMEKMLDYVIARGALSAVKEAPVLERLNGYEKCLKVRFPALYGFADTRTRK